MPQGDLQHQTMAKETRRD